MSSEPLINDRYEIVCGLGAGSFGNVYRARDRKLDVMVAIKVLRRDQGSTVQDRWVVRFQNEAKAASKLSHPGIARILDFGIGGDDTIFLVSELIEGPTLEQELSKKGSLEPESAIRLLTCLAESMSFVHSKGIVHRDLKPGNIILKQAKLGETFPVVVDFGIARILDSPDSSGALTIAGSIVGSPAYMSPEQGRGDTVDSRSDIYSLGCIAFEMLSGAPPYMGKSQLDTLRLHQEGPVPDLRLDDRRSAAINQLIGEMIAKSPDDRPVSMDELVKRLERIENASIESEESPARPEKRAGLSLIGLVLLPVVIALAAAALFLPGLLEQKPERTVSGNSTGKFKSVGEDLEDLLASSPFHVNQEGRYLHINANPVFEGRLDWGMLARYEGNPIILGLDECALTDPDIEEIPHIKGVKGLNLNKTRISESQIVRLIESVRPESLQFYQSEQLKDRALSSIGGLGSLKELSIVESSLTDDLCSRLNQLKGLRKLNLSKNAGLSSKAIRSLVSRLPLLGTLELEETGLADDAMDVIGSLEYLQGLYISETMVSDRGIGRLRNPLLIELEIKGIRVSDSSLERLSALPSLKTVYIDMDTDTTVAGRRKFESKKGRRVIPVNESPYRVN